MSIELVKEKLKTDNKTLKVIADHLIEHCVIEPEFKNKIMNDKKSLEECMQYIMSEAKKQSINGSAMIDNETVFGWAIHYFDEEELQFEKVQARVDKSTKSNIEDTEEDEEDLEAKPKNSKSKEKKSKEKTTKFKIQTEEETIEIEQISLF